MKWAWACNTLLLCSLVHSSNHTSIHTTSHLHISHMRQSHFEFNFLGTHTISLGRFTLYLFYYYLHSVKRLLLAFCLHLTIALMSLSLSIATEHFDILFESVGFFLSFFFSFLIFTCVFMYMTWSSSCCGSVCNFPLHLSPSISSSFSLSLSLLLVHFLQYFVCNKNLIATTTATTTLCAAYTHTRTHTLHTQQQRQSLSTLYGAPMFRQRPRFLHGPDHDHA